MLMKTYARKMLTFSKGMAFPKCQRVSTGPKTHSKRQKEPYCECVKYF